jgi:hypothetical protein
MSLAASIREQVRQRAYFACEFCGITEIDAGGMLIKRLRLNRSQLITARQRRQQQSQVERLLQRYQELTTLQAQINIQLTDLAMEQQVLLKEQRKWLRKLLSRLNNNL